MKHALHLIAAATLTACTQPGTGNTVSEADLQGSCAALVSAETGIRPDDVTAVSTQTGPTGSVTTVSVAGAQTPWLCAADPFGVITGVEVSPMG